MAPIRSRYATRQLPTHRLPLRAAEPITFKPKMAFGFPILYPLPYPFPIEHWHEYLASPTLADAILDRLVHGAHKLILKGGSMRKATARQKNGSSAD